MQIGDATYFTAIGMPLADMSTGPCPRHARPGEITRWESGFDGHVVYLDEQGESDAAREIVRRYAASHGLKPTRDPNDLVTEVLERQLNLRTHSYVTGGKIRR